MSLAPSCHVPCPIESHVPRPLSRSIEDMRAPALAESFEEHRGHLLSVAYRLTGSIADAEDAVQDAWLRLDGADATASMICGHG